MRCLFIQRDGHVRLTTQGDFGSSLHHGFSLCINVQPEGSSPSILVGTGVTGQTSLVLRYNDHGIKNMVRLDLSDDDGKVLSARAQCSDYAGKRLMVSVDVANNVVNFYELNILPCEEKLESIYLRKETPSRFSNFRHELLLGGACIDGKRVGEISAKVGDLFIWRGAWTDMHVRKLSAEFRTELLSFYGNEVYEVHKSAERRQLFREDAEKLREWDRKPQLSNADARECAGLVFRCYLILDILCSKTSAMRLECN
jgi:hypothetical protein